MVLPHVDAWMVQNQLTMSVFDAAAAKELPSGYKLGERHIVDEEGPTKSIVWEALPVSTPA